MTSVFRKLISKEFGVSKYNKYFFIYQKKVSDKSYDFKNLNNEEIFNDIYEELQDKDKDILNKKLEKLTEAMFLALRINKNYIFTFLFYLAATLFIISQELMPVITISSLALMSGCFIYKTYEFVVNKFCYIDAHIVIVYKAVLDKLIVRKGR